MPSIREALVWFLTFSQSLALPASANDKLLLPPGTGLYNVTLKISEFTDENRLDPYNASHYRKLMVSRFDPVPPDCCKPMRVPYMTSVTAQVESDIFTPYGFPEHLWSRFELEVCDPSQTDLFPHPKPDFPIALFGPGLNTSRLFYSSLAQQLASYGITVLTIDHPYDTDVVEFPNGDVIYALPIQTPSGPNDTNTGAVEKALSVRADDISFVISTLNFTNVVATGHSFGGGASATAMRQDTRIKAGLNLDGAMFGDVILSGFDRPDANLSYILWGAEGHNTTSPENLDYGWSSFWGAINAEKNVWKREFTVDGSVHSTYWDLNVCVDVAGLDRQALAETSGITLGEVSGQRGWEILGTYLPVYFKAALGIEEDSQGLLDRPVEEFEEVKILRR